jgi:hypothetical protein
MSGLLSRLLRYFMHLCSECNILEHEIINVEEDRLKPALITLQAVLFQQIKPLIQLNF